MTALVKIAKLTVENDNFRAGGFYSTTNDLLTLGTAIANGSLLGSAATRKWLQPVAATSTTGRMIGAPWEILRSTSLTVDNRQIDIPLKSGDIGTYHAKLALLPDYDLVIAVLSAGPQVDFELSFQLLSTVLTTLTPGLEQASKDETTAAGYLGTFADVASNSSITLGVDDGPGLAVTNWIVRGLDAVGIYKSSAIAGLGDDTVIRPRLYPTYLTGANNTVGWRAVFDVGTAEEMAASDAGFAWVGQSCQTWAGLDRFVYAFLSIDEFVFTLSDGGDVVALENRGFQVNMTRKG